MTNLKLRAAALGLVFIVGVGAEAAANTLTGAYLAGRAAATRHDYVAAADWFSAALARNPTDTGLRDRALTLRMMSGDLRGSAAIAGALAAVNPGHQLAALALVSEALRTGDADLAMTRLDLPGSGLNPLVAGLLRGWTALEQGDAAGMEAAFDGLGADAAGGLFSNYHRALARAAMGDAAGAREAFDAMTATGAALEGRPALAFGAVVETLDEPDEARALYAHLAEAGDAQATAALARLNRGEPAAALVRDAREGAAEALLSIAGALGSDRNASLALVYARLALTLRPDLHDARLLTGGLLDRRERHDDAVAVFEGVPRSAPQYLAAEVARADGLVQLGRLDEAVEALRSAADAAPEALTVHLALGAALRRAERWAEAAAAYDVGIALIDPVEGRHWPVFYERGIAHERAGAWPHAEADFKRALELEPDQPLVLNYLGYSWVEMRRHLPEAQAMIERAVEQRPDDGYITDSLGWVLYRLGKYDEAVPVMERAVELVPVDPVITDHLGDVLWMVGRKMEARYQWRRALSFEPDDKDIERIRRKLDAGLDVVLAEEAAAEAQSRAEAAAALAAAKNDG